MNFPAPTFDGNITPTRVFGITTPTDVSVGGRAIVGLAATAPAYTLDVRGNAQITSSMTLGSAGLTGGNTGTVAVLSDVPMVFSVGWSNQNPADSINYGLNTTGAFSTSMASNCRMTLPFNCTLIGFDYTNWNAGGNSNARNAQLKVVNQTSATTYTLSSAITFSSTNQRVKDFTKSINFNANDEWYPLLLTPTWSTNPLQTFMQINFYFVRRK